MTLEDWRAELDLIDNELLRLLNRRARLASKAGALESCAPGRAGRDADALDRACRANAGPLGEQSVTKIFRRIVRETRRDAAHALTRDLSPHAPHEEVGELV